MKELILLVIIIAALAYNEREHRKDVKPPDDEPPLGIGGNP